MQYSAKDGYLDLNAHILPEIDFGSSCLIETKTMLKKAYVEGIRIIVATPYYHPKREFDTTKLKRTFEVVCKEGKSMFPDMRFILGSEIYYHEEILETLKRKKAYTLGETSYVLIDFEPTVTYTKMYQGIRKVIEGGYWPILAHVEHYDCLLHRMERCIDLIRLGSYMQLDCDSVIGSKYNKRVAFCSKLLKENIIHFLGSNCCNYNTHPPIMNQCMSVLKKKLSSSQIERLTVSNVERFLNNKYIDN